MSRHKNIPSKGKGNLYDSDEDEFTSSSVEDSYSISPDTASRYMYNPSRADSRGFSNAFVQIKDSRSQKIANNNSKASFITPDEFPDNEDNSIFQCDEQVMPNGSKPSFQLKANLSTPKQHISTSSSARSQGDGVSNNVPNVADKKNTHNVNQRNVTVIPPQPCTDNRPVSGTHTSQLTPIKFNQSSGDLKQLAASTPSKPVSDYRTFLLQAYEARSHEQHEKPSLNIVIIGHVDAGKSTLMGHLLYRLGEVDDRQMTRYQREAQKLGKASFAFAWILDQTEEERSRGVTMDVAQTAFETPNKRIVVLDAPGHRDFIPRMITGTAQADAAILVINATRGEFESGFSTGETSSTSESNMSSISSLTSSSTSAHQAPTEGQTREHAILARALGINQFLVAINKMDTVDWNQERFNYICTHLEAFLRKLGSQLSIQFCPVSGLEGTNVFAKVQDQSHPLNSWYKGPCLLDHIDSLQCPGREIDKPVRFSVSDVFKPSSGAGCCVSGRVESGGLAAVSVNAAASRLLSLPSAQEVTVKAISRTAVQRSGLSSHTNNGYYSNTSGEQSLNYAFAGDFVCLHLLCNQPDMLEPGCVLSDPSNPVGCSDKFRGQLLIVHIPPKRALCRGYKLLFHCQSITATATIKKMHKFQGKDGKRKVELINPRVVTQLGQLEVTIELDRIVCLEATDETRALGRFTLRSGDRTIAGGNVTKVLTRTGS